MADQPRVHRAPAGRGAGAVLRDDRLHRDRGDNRVTAAVTLAAVALSMTSGGAPTRPGISVSPAHLALAAGGRATIHVRAVSGRRLLLRTSIAGLALDPRGRPQIVARRDAAAWLTVQPRTIST